MRVDRRRAGQRRFFRARDDRQRFILDVDELERIRRDGLGLGDDEGNRVADIAHLVVAEYRPIDLMHPAVFTARDIAGGQHSDDAWQRFGPADVHFQQPRVRVFAAQGASVQHAFDVEVVGVDTLAGDLVDRIGAGQRAADRLERRLDGGQRRDRLSGSLLDGTDNGVMAGAATDVPAVAVIDFFECRVGALLQQRDRRHDEARGAEAALGGTLVDVGLLDRVKAAAAGAGDALDGRNFRTAGAAHLDQARADCFTILDDDTTAAVAGRTAILDAGQPQLIAERVHQERLRGRRDFAPPAIDRERIGLLLSHQFHLH